MFVETGTRTGGSACGERADAELGSAPTEWIEREVGELAAHIAAAMAHWLELVAELDRRSAHEAWGFHSCGAWLAWRCGIDPRSAREHVRIARALSDLPLVAEQFGRGLLSYSKVRAITRIAEPSNEAELVEMARFATAAQLERIVRGCRRAVSLESAEAAHRDRFLAWEWDDDGSLLLRGRLSPEDGASFVKAIEAGEEEIRDREEATGGGSQGGSAEPRARRADALMEVADVFLAGGAAERRGGDRHQVVVHAEAASLATEREVPGCALQDGPALCNESARRIACDASLVRVTHGPAGALDIGRKSRTVPARRPPHRPLGQGRSHQARQPDLALHPPSPPCARGRVLGHEVSEGRDPLSPPRRVRGATPPPPRAGQLPRAAGPQPRGGTPDRPTGLGLTRPRRGV